MTTTLKPSDIAAVHGAMVSDQAAAPTEVVKQAAEQTAINAQDLHAKNQQLALALVEQPMLIGGRENTTELHTGVREALDKGLQDSNTQGKLAADFAVTTSLKVGGVLPNTLNNHLAAVKAQLDSTLSHQFYQPLALAKATGYAAKATGSAVKPDKIESLGPRRP